MTAPRISIVIPSYNQGRFLPQALDSLFADPDTLPEVVVVDGASQDDSVAVLQRYGEGHPTLRWISEPDDGPADAVNKGLAMASGEILGIQSADDFCLPGALRAAQHALDQDPTLGMVYGDVKGVDIDGNPTFRRRFPEFSHAALFAISCTLAQGSIYFRRSVYEAIGGWNARYYSCDLDYWMRIALRYPVRRIPQTLSAWRVYAGNRTSAGPKIWEGYWRMIEESPELQAASPQLRRWARASAHLLALRFPPRSSRGTQLLHGWRGALLHPGFWRYNPWRRSLLLLPGWPTARAAYHALRR